MRTKILWFPALLIAAAALAFQNKPVAEETLFWIGTADGRSMEFARKTPVAQVVFQAGKDQNSAWPFLQPRNATFTVRFSAEKKTARPLFLITGFSNTSESCQLAVELNGVPVATREVPFRALDQSIDPYTWSNPNQLVYKLPQDGVRQGENTLTLKVLGGAWIIYDYLYLGTNQRPPQLLKNDPDLLQRAQSGPMAGVQDVVFAVRTAANPNNDPHWYANFGYYAQDENRKAYGSGGRLCRLNLASRKITALIDDPKGSVRDPQVHYDGKHIVFAWRKGGTENFHLYEINADGSGLRQLTSGNFDDFEPTYLPDGGIAFVSSRCKRWVNCWLTQVATMYRCDRNGQNVLPISANTEQDNTPWPLPDGRLLYTRWEYVDRSQVHYHHLWAGNPDGTGQTIYYGNFYGGVVMIDAKPVPGSDKVVAVFSPGHGAREHAGIITLVDPKAGPDERSSAQRISRRGSFRDPWAFSEDCFLAAFNSSLMLLNRDGVEQELFALSQEDVRAGLHLHEPRPLIPRKTERVIPPRVNLASGTGTLVLGDVYKGRNMAGVKRGEIKKLLVLESLPMPVHYTGGMQPISNGGTFTLERILGTVPVEPDGSAHFNLPAHRSVFFVALDENDLAVKRMQSFTSVAPGEVTSCVGCHERRVETPPLSAAPLMALRREPSRIQPISDVPDVLDFPRDIQPILNRNCTKCHSYEKPSANVILSGDRGPMYSHSYFYLTLRRQFSDGRNKPESNYAPRTLGSSASVLLKKLSGGHHGVEATPLERKTVRLWIETGAAYPGTYAALGSGSIGDYGENKAIRHDIEWPGAKALASTISRKCGSCHRNQTSLPLTVSHDVQHMGGSKWPISRHTVFNLSDPAKSLMLLAPLSTKSGGYGLCGGTGVFADTADPDYATILGGISEAKQKLEEMTRFDMPNFRPRSDWTREMKRFGILAGTVDPASPIDVYSVERKYWESLWYRPQ